VTPDGSLIALTLALVLITGYYAWQTHEMVDEMRRTRIEDATMRLREKSERAARHCLEEIRIVLDAMDIDGVTGISRDIVRHLHRNLTHEGPLILDEIVKDHILATAQVAFVASLETAQMQRERLNPSAVAVNLRMILVASRSTLQDFLSERQLPPSHWSVSDVDGGSLMLPASGEASAWVRREGQTLT